jgi:hypothetical protein
MTCKNAGLHSGKRVIADKDALSAASGLGRQSLASGLEALANTARPVEPTWAYSRSAGDKRAWLARGALHRCGLGIAAG